MNLHIGHSGDKQFDLPPDLATQTVAILGVRGSGKTNTGVIEAEELLTAGQQVIVIDPLDVWWGLRADGAGAKGGYPITVLGGEHADLPLDEAAGKTVAEFLVAHRAPAILSTRHLSKAGQRRFVACRTCGWIVGTRDHLQITQEGMAALGDFDPLPEGRELLAYWLQDLGNSGAARMLAVLADCYPDSLCADDLGSRAGVDANGGSFGTYLGRLRSLELVSGSRGELRLSEELAE